MRMVQADGPLGHVWAFNGSKMAEATDMQGTGTQCVKTRTIFRL